MTKNDFANKLLTLLENGGEQDVVLDLLSFFSEVEKKDKKYTQIEDLKFKLNRLNNKSNYTKYTAEVAKTKVLDELREIVEELKNTDIKLDVKGDNTENEKEKNKSKFHYLLSILGVAKIQIEAEGSGEEGVKATSKNIKIGLWVAVIILLFFFICKVCLEEISNEDPAPQPESNFCDSLDNFYLNVIKTINESDSVKKQKLSGVDIDLHNADFKTLRSEINDEKNKHLETCKSSKPLFENIVHSNTIKILKRYDVNYPQ